jgi:putative MFS transporter
VKGRGKLGLTGLSQTSGVGLALWAPTLLLLLLRTTPEEASFLMIWVGLSAFFGRVTCAFLSELMGRRWSGITACFGAVCTLILAGAFPDVFIGTVSVFWLMLVAHAFFSGGSYSIIAPYLAEVWPTGLRASGMGLGYGVGNLGKIISPLGLALIVGGSNFIKPEARVDAIMPAMLFLAFWAALAAFAFLFLGIETKGRSIEEIDASMARPTDAVRVRAG